MLFWGRASMACVRGVIPELDASRRELRKRLPRSVLCSRLDRFRLPPHRSGPAGIALYSTMCRERLDQFCRMSSLGCTEQAACVFGATYFGSGFHFLEKASAGELAADQTPLDIGRSSGECQADLQP